MIVVAAGLMALLLAFGCSAAAHPDWVKSETSYTSLRHPKDWKMTPAEESSGPTFREKRPDTLYYVGPTGGWKDVDTAERGGSDDSMYELLSGLMSAGVSIAEFDAGGDLSDRELLEEALAEDGLKYVEGEQEMKNDKGIAYGDGAKLTGTTGKLNGATSFRLTMTWDPISKTSTPDKQRQALVAAKDGKLIIVWFTPSGLLTDEQLAAGKDVMESLSFR